ncbi:MAG: DNA repair exonuclease [Nanoarchaeota archaeon]|nr:DNA repair exonuclease [Nanoarchaeota archaeon]
MKFIHVADTHLGRGDKNVEARVHDFYNAFKQVVDFAIKEKVDFIVHSGDFFDKARPPINTLVFATKQLERLKESKIPIFLIAGSHDIGVGETILTLFDELGLIKNLSSSRYYKIEDGKIHLDGEMFRDVFVCGVPGKRANIEEIYKRIVPANKGKYKIFMFHHTISDISEKFADIPTSVLPKGFDYYAGGHWHGFYEKKYDKGIIIYPGSTEFNDITEAEKNKERCFMLVDIDKNKIEKIKLNVREHIIYKINCSGLDAKEVADKCINEIKEIKKDAVLVIKLYGRLKKGTKAEVNRNKIISWGKDAGFLATKVYIGDLENPEKPFVSAGIKSPSKIEEEYLKQQKYNTDEIKLAKDIIKIMGNVSGKEVEVAKDEIIQLIEGVLIENKKD